MKYTVRVVNPNDILLQNPGAAYEPVDMAGLYESFEITGNGPLVPPICYVNEDGKLTCLEGNHRVLASKKRQDKEITVLVIDIPEAPWWKQNGVDAEIWKLLARLTVNTIRREPSKSELRFIFERLRDKGFSQEQISRWWKRPGSQSEVSRILSAKPEAPKKKVRDARDTVEPAEVKVEPKIMGSPITPANAMDFINRGLQERFKQAESGDREAILHLRWLAWHVLRKLIQLGIEPYDPKDENPE